MLKFKNDKIGTIFIRDFIYKPKNNIMNSTSTIDLMKTSNGYSILENDKSVNRIGNITQPIIQSQQIPNPKPTKA